VVTPTEKTADLDPSRRDHHPPMTHDLADVASLVGVSTWTLSSWLAVLSAPLSARMRLEPEAMMGDDKPKAHVFK
jgi:hypothetical protein